MAQARTLLVKPAAERSKQQPVAKSKLFGEADRDAQLDAVKVQEAATKLSEEERAEGSHESGNSAAQRESSTGISASESRVAENAMRITGRPTRNTGIQPIIR